MSEAYRNLQNRISRMKQRIEQTKIIKTELDTLIAESEIDIVAMKLRLKVLRYEGDGQDTP